MDMFAFGGWPLLLTYSAIVGYSAYALVFTFMRQKSYDGTFTALAIAWICYQVQSIISINQIGLAIWGWLLGGTVIAYYRVARKNDLNQTSIESNSKRKRIDSGLRTLKVGDYRVVIASFVTGLIGLIIALPPYTSDVKWKAAISSANLSQIEDSMKSSYFNPQNTTRYLSNIQLLEGNKLGDVAHKYTLQAIEWNPEVYDFWRLLYFLSKSSTADKERAVIKMKLLDPLNPDLTAKL